MAGRILESLSTDLSTRVYRVTNGFNEALYLVTNEPSLGMFRLQEHVQLTVPKVVEQRQALQQVCQQVDGACYDLGYDSQTVQAMSKVSRFPSISAKLLQAVELKTRLDELELDAKKSGLSSSHSGGTTSYSDASPSPHSATSHVPVQPVTYINSDLDCEIKPKTFN